MVDTDFETIQWSYDDEEDIGTIVLDRPDSLNALSSQLRADIVAGFEAFEELDDETPGATVRAVIVEGAGDRAFSAGADINEFEDSVPGEFEPSREYEVAERFPAPVIAKIHGYALGGGLEFALSCDFRIASDESTVGLPEVDLGILPGGGGPPRLLPIVGPSRTKEICMTGEHIPAPQAEEEGIVDHVYPADDLDDEVRAFAETLAGKPPLSVRAIKDVVNTSTEVGMREGRMYASRASGPLRETEDHRRGVEAFFGDAEPAFEGR